MYPVKLAGPRITVRELNRADADSVFVYARDREVHRYMIWQGSDEIQDTLDWLDLADQTARAEPRTIYHLAIEIREAQEMVGGVSLFVNFKDDRGSIGYVLRREAWGHGYATDAVGLVARFAFRELGLHRLFAHVDIDNVASARVLEKVGMSREGLLRQLERIGNSWRDVYLYAKLDRD